MNLILYLLFLLYTFVDNYIIYTFDQDASNEVLTNTHMDMLYYQTLIFLYTLISDIYFYYFKRTKTFGNVSYMSSIFVFHNIFYLFGFIPTSLDLYIERSANVWLFTSPFLYYLNNLSINKPGVDLTLVLIIIVHLLHLETYMGNYVSNAYVILYALYSVIIYNFIKTDNHTILNLWMIFGITGSMYNLHVIDSSHYVTIVMINDVLAKIVVICHYNNRIMQIEMSHHDIDIDTYKILVQFKNMMKDKCDNSSLMKINEYIHQVLYTRIPMHTDSNSQNSVLSSIKTNMIDKVVPNDIDDRTMLELIEEPKTLNDVVVLFTDVVGYSRICKHHPSIEIMETLDQLYSNYDQCIENLPELYKIENIGDCYMITSSNIIGRKYQNHEVLHSFLKFSREILDISTKMEIDIRIGIHVGSVTVGIIGSINPRFGVVGNTVNIAARLESTCVINNLHVSEEFYEQIKEYLKKDMIISNTELKNIGIKKTVHIQADDFQLNNDNNS